MGMTIAELVGLPEKALAAMDPEERAFWEEETDIPHDAPEISEAVLERMQAETDTHAALMLNRDLPYHETVGMTPDELLAWGRAKQRAAQDDSDDPPF